MGCCLEGAKKSATQAAAPAKEPAKAPLLEKPAEKPAEPARPPAASVSNVDAANHNAAFTAAAPKAPEPMPPSATVFPHEQKRPSETAPAAAVQQQVQLGVGSRVDVFSSTHQAWCPGFIHEMDDKEIQVTYQVANASPENNILMKAVPVGSPDIRPPADDKALAFGTVVEVFSHSWQKWCPGRVEDVTEGVATVFFLYPDMTAESEPVMKKLPVNHEDLRLPIIGQAANQLGLVVGSSVEVYSNSLNQWLPGRVQELGEGNVVVSFHYPDMDPSAGAAIKELPFGHQDLRLPSIAPADAGYFAGIKIEVYSHSRQFWCPGQVEAVTENMITCLLKYPDLPDEAEPVTKVLPVGDPDLRLAASQ